MGRMPMEMEVVVHGVKVFADGYQVEFAPPKDAPVHLHDGRVIAPMPVNEGMYLFVGGMAEFAKTLPRRKRELLDEAGQPRRDEQGKAMEVWEEGEEEYHQRVACSYALDKTPELVQVAEHRPDDSKPAERRVAPVPGTFTITITASE
jgi:hypothetical protein